MSKQVLVDSKLWGELYQLILDMSAASSVAEVEGGMSRLEQIRAQMEQQSPEEARKEMQKLKEQIDWLKLRLERLRQHIQEKGAYLLAKQERKDELSMFNTELIDAVVRATHDDEERQKELLPGETPKERPQVKKPEEAREDEKEKTAVLKASAAWSRSERLAAHMAACLQAEPDFFVRLKQKAKRNLPRIVPGSELEADAHFRDVAKLGKRLVNLERHTRAIAEAAASGQSLSRLLQTASEEIKDFTRELKACKQNRPNLAGEYERLFGGYAQFFAETLPTKGETILELCAKERRKVEAPVSRRQQPEAAPRPEAAPQQEERVLVLRRDDAQS